MRSERRRRRGYASALTAALLLPLCAAGCGPRAEPPRPHVLLVTIDTLRADRLGSYGHFNETSPVIDRLAARGVRFDDASVQWPKTWPSMASMLTGTYPATNGVVLAPHRALGEEQVTLAERLRDAGYRTAAVVANVNLGGGFGFAQGFDRFVESWAEPMAREGRKPDLVNAPGAVKRYTNATLVTEQALELIGACGDAGAPCFWWVHYIDPHGPYVPPEAHADHFAGSYARDDVHLDVIPKYQRQRAPGGAELTTDLGFYRLQYDREIRYLDTEMERLLAAAEARPGDRDVLILFTADHGESLGERGDALRHGFVPYQTNARVPLVLAWPGRLPAGHVVRAPVGLIDLAPTLLALLELPATGLAGRELVSALRDESQAPAYVFVESGHEKETQLAVRRGAWKLVRMRSFADRVRLRAPELALYDVRADPNEERDLAAQHPDVVRELDAALEAWLRGTPVHAGGDAAPVDEDTRDMLRALGYVE